MSNVHITYEIESYLQHLSLAVASRPLLPSATYWHSDLLCQVTSEYWQKWRKKKYYWDTVSFFSSLFLGQTITDCDSKRGWENSIKIWGMLPSVRLIRQQYLWGYRGSIYTKSIIPHLLTSGNTICEILIAYF